MSGKRILLKTGKRNLLKTGKRILLAVAVVLVVTAGCRGAGPSASRPNVLLLSIDTLRADHLGAYGYAVTPSPSPWMDELASHGVVFEHAVTSAPETAPALATLVTGVYQDRHGLTYNRAKLAPQNHTVAERLKEAGYATAAFVGNWLVDADHGFGQGFDRFEVVPPAGPGNPTTDDKLAALFGDFLRKRSTDHPWFAWVHMMDPHGPYDSAPLWWSRDFDYSRAPLRHDGEFPATDSNFGLGVIPRYQKLAAAKSLSDYVRRYDGEIRFTDSQVGALLGLVAAAGDRANTVVIVTADHGESLDEHNELLQHGWFVYDTTVRIPLLVSGPGFEKGSRAKEVTCSVDVVPTILDAAGVDADGSDFDGRPVGREGGATGTVSPMAGTAAELREAGCFSIGPRKNRPFSLRTARHKLIVTPAGTARDPLAPKGEDSTAPEVVELYDLTADPGETNDLATNDLDVTESMQQQVTALRSRFRRHNLRW